MVGAISCTVFIFALMIGGFFLLPTAHKDLKLSNVAITLIDALGDRNNIEAGQVTAPCLATIDDAITDQFTMLLQKIRAYPGSTTYLNGVYVTVAPGDRRPIFQIRYPAPEYCAPFVAAYKACFSKSRQAEDAEKQIGATGACVKEAAQSLHVKEDWSGLIEEHTPKAR
ncbi:MAG: hypothetical protein H7249_01315 [Chitinophagaceae bacterium]|nr:hypothetical protein [Oligoflexus sp.]